MRIITPDGTTINGSLSEVLAVIDHFKGPVAAKPVTEAKVTETAVTAKVATIHAQESVLPEWALSALKQTPERDTVIRYAIADVERLLQSEHYDADTIAHVGDAVDFALGAESDHVDFFINADKGTVVAKLLLNSVTFDTTIRAGTYATTGTAKCAPGDVFNEHIGKAIALRRALGLSVPSAYYESKARDRDDLAVGDVVSDNEAGCDDTYEITQLIRNPEASRYPGQAFKHDDGFGWLASSQVTLINDSSRHTAPELATARIIRHEGTR